jgi:ABC-type nitrate/sulfonate/bicarbonate transport system permease component
LTRRARFFVGAASVLTLAAAWEAAADLGLAPPAVLPPPHALLAHAARLAGPGGKPPYALERDAAATLLRLGVGFVAAAAVAVPLGVGMAFQPWLRRLARPVLSVFLPVPALAFVPVLMLLTGIGGLTDYAVVFLTAVVPVAATVHDGVRSLPRAFYWTASSLGAGAGRAFFAVTLPGAVLPIVSGFRVGIGYAWRSLVATEGITALTHGLGYTIFQANNFFDTPTVYVYMGVIALLGLAIEGLLLAPLERATAGRWGLVSHAGRAA